MKTGKHSSFYIKLGQKYEKKNPNQAYLCYENALHYSRDREETADAVHVIDRLKAKYTVNVSKTAIILLSYNYQQITKDCIQSIRQNNHPSTYELIVVDNASSDGIQEWLIQQENIKLILNDDNRGFPIGCNQGIELADQTFDIFLLNNDTVVPCDALFWLRMGLYERDNIGATGSVSNAVANDQQVAENFDTLSQWIDYADKNNVPMQYPYEKKAWLIGFAMLIKRAALDKVGILDARFSPGHYEDNDLCIRILQQGYQLLLCKNSFIYHYGSKSFGENEKEQLKLVSKNEKKLSEKYGFNYAHYNFVDPAIVDMIQPHEPVCNVLEIGAKLGCTLARLESKYQGIQVVGIENNEKLRIIAKQVTNLKEGNCLEGRATFWERAFDYIILDGTIAVENDPVLLLQKAKRLLKRTGKMIVSVKNADCIKKFSNDREGVYLRLEEILAIFARARLVITQSDYSTLVLTEQEKQKLMKQAQGNADEILLHEAYTFIFEVKAQHHDNESASESHGR
ncbi:glycosyltransferase [Lachnospiraceae bacterium ZAX-1]